MNTSITIIKMEWRLLTADRTAWLALAVCVIASIAAITNGARLARERQAAVQEVRSEVRRAREAVQAKAQLYESEIERKLIPFTIPVPYPGPTNPFWASWNARPFALLPPGPLAALTVGNEEMQPTVIPVYSPGYTPIQQTPNPLAMLSGHWDLTFVVVYLLPLLIISLTFNLVAGERETGRLVLLLSQPLTLRTLVMAKLLLRLLLIVGATGLSIGIELFLQRDVIGSAGAGRIGTWCAFAGVYGVFWCAISIMVNSFNYKAATNALILLTCWIFLAVLLPAVLLFAARVRYPLPSRLQYINSERDIDDHLKKIKPLSREPNLAATRDRFLKMFFDHHPEITSYAKYDSEEGRYRIFNEAKREEKERLMKPLQDEVERAQHGQEIIVERMSYVIPPLLLERSLETVSGSGPARYTAYRNEVNDFVLSWRAWFWPKLFRNAVFASDDYMRIPEFTFVEEPFVPNRRQIAEPFASLIAFSLAFGSLGQWRFRRYRVVE